MRPSPFPWWVQTAAVVVVLVLIFGFGATK